MSQGKLYVSDLLVPMAVDHVFALHNKSLKKTKKGDLYISAQLGDRTGKVEAVMWQANEAVYNHIQDGGLVHVKGRTEEYRGKTQIVIEACRPVSPDSVDISEFIATTPHDVDKMWTELLEILRTIKDKYLRMLIKRFVEDEKISSGFKKAPAAVQMHHAYTGGLCEHTLSVAKAARAILPNYPDLNHDLVLASVFLHDIAKIEELHSGLNTYYSDRGQLVGHLVIACLWIEKKAAEVSEELSEPFPQKLIDLLQHIVLAHHGQHEFGSPKLPAVPEAFFIHYLDNLDAKMWMTSNAIHSDTDPDSAWTQYINALETRLFKGSRDNSPADGMLFLGYDPRDE